MTRYLISFDDGAMTFPEEELPDVDKAAHEAVREAQDAGVWVFGGGLKGHEVALEWAAEIALACRCAQEVRELLPDATV
jgi:hypothetical protein